MIRRRLVYLLRRGYIFWSSTCLFFFSSRRRHTRSLCDWSSDVCSSDLEGAAAVESRTDLAVRGDDRAIDEERVVHARAVLVANQPVGNAGPLQPRRRARRRLMRRNEDRSEEHTSELQSHSDLVCRLLLE